MFVSSRPCFQTESKCTCITNSLAIFLIECFVLCNTTALDTEVSSWGGVIVTPGQKAYEKQQDQEDEEGEGEGDDEDEESSEMSGQELTEEKMETSQESWTWSLG